MRHYLPGSHHMPAIDAGEMLVTLINGASEMVVPVAGFTIRAIWDACGTVLNIHPQAGVFVNGARVGEDYKVAAGDIVEFIRASGIKGLGPLLSPDALQSRLQINQSQYEELLRIGLPIFTFSDGTAGHFEDAVEEWLRDTGRVGNVASPGGHIEANRGAADTGVFNLIEENILEALADKTLTGEKIAPLAGYSCDGRFKEILAGLVRRGVLGNKKPGYYRLKKESHDQRQD